MGQSVGPTSKVGGSNKQKQEVHFTSELLRNIFQGWGKLRDERPSPQKTAHVMEKSVVPKELTDTQMSGPL